MNAAQVTSDAAAIGKLVDADGSAGKVAVTDDAADISAALDTLDGADIASITISDNGTITLNASAVSSDAKAISKLKNANGAAYVLAVTDTAADISAAVNSLDGAHIASITISDSQPVTFKAAQLTSDATAMAKLVNANGEPVEIIVSDTAKNIAADIATIEADVANISSIASTSGTVTVSAATFAADQSALDKIVGGFVVSDSLAAIAGDLSGLDADPAVSEVIGANGSATLSGGAGISAPMFALTGSGTTLTVAETLTYAGAFSLGAGAIVSISAADELILTAAATVKGAIDGAGELATNGGAATIGSGAAISVTEWASSDETIDLGAALAYAGVFEAGADDTLSETGGALTLNGATSLSGGVTIDGGHLLTLDGATTVSGALNISGAGGVTVGATLTDSGGNTTLGVAGDAAKLTIAAGGTWDLTDDSSLLIGEGAEWSIANKGLLEKTGGSSISQMAAAIANTGTIEVSAATLDLQGAVSGSGSDLVSGAATLEFAGSVAAGQSVQFSGSGGTLELLDPTAFSAKISDFDAGGASGDALSLAAPWTLSKFVENSAHTSGTMTLSNETTTTTLTLLGSYAANGFTSSTNASGMTVITYA